MAAHRDLVEITAVKSVGKQTAFTLRVAGIEQEILLNFGVPRGDIESFDATLSPDQVLRLTIRTHQAPLASGSEIRVKDVFELPLNTAPAALTAETRLAGYSIFDPLVKLQIDISLEGDHWILSYQQFSRWGAGFENGAQIISSGKVHLSELFHEAIVRSFGGAPFSGNLTSVAVTGRTAAGLPILVFVFDNYVGGNTNLKLSWVPHEVPNLNYLGVDIDPRLAPPSKPVVVTDVSAPSIARIPGRPPFITAAYLPDYPASAN